jgi:carbonic anhydrase
MGSTLHQLLECNARHTESLSAGHFADVQEGQEPTVVSVCCSDSRVPQDGMWDVDEPGWLFAPSTIGNQVWDRHDGELVVEGSVHYPMAHAGTTVAAVVGHTGCGAVTAALEAVGEGTVPDAPGVRKWIELLRPVVEDGLADGRVDPDGDVALVDQLVEYNVDRQVAFLRGSGAVPDGGSVYGFVYDFQGVYGDVPGRAYLVNADGETDTGALRDLVPAAFDDHVRRLL